MTLTAHLWQSTLWAAAAASIVVALRRAPARYRHAIWMLAATKFLVPFALIVAAGAMCSAWLGAAQLPLGYWIRRSAPFFTLHSGTSGRLGMSAGNIDWIWAVFLLVWISGAAALLIWRLRQWRAVLVLVRQATPLTSGREAEALARVRRKWTCAPAVNLRQGNSTLEPAIVGVLTPAIVWPNGLSERLTDDELEAVFAHEIAHVKRYDNLMAWLQIAAETVFWFYPLTWWLGRRIVDERERACDEEVAQMGTDARIYAAAILKVCTFCLRTPATFVAGVGSANLAQRIERILTTTSGRTRARVAGLTGLCFGLAMVVTPLTLGALAADGPNQQPPNVYSAKGRGVTAPKLVKETKPGYTPEALHARVEGSVRLEAVVLTTGKVGDVKITQSLDKQFGLDDRAVATVKKWEFEPGRKDGKAVPVRVEIEMSFTLK